MIHLKFHLFIFKPKPDAKYYTKREDITGNDNKNDEWNEAAEGCFMIGSLNTVITRDPQEYTK